MLVIKQAASVFKKRRAALPQALALLSLQVQHIQEGLVALRRCPRACMHTHSLSCHCTGTCILCQTTSYAFHLCVNIIKAARMQPLQQQQLLSVVAKPCTSNSRARSGNQPLQKASVVFVCRYIWSGRNGSMDEAGKSMTLQQQ